MPIPIAEKSVLIRAPLAQVWEIISDVVHWSEWNPSLGRIELLETPKVDAIGRISPASGAPFQFKIRELSPGTLFEWEREYELGTKLVYRYVISRNAEGAIFTSALSSEGRFATMIAGLMRKRFSRNLEVQADQLRDFCELHRAAKTRIAEEVRPLTGSR